jgi:hypothetical protein
MNAMRERRRLQQASDGGIRARQAAVVATDRTWQPDDVLMVDAPRQRRTPSRRDLRDVEVVSTHLNWTPCVMAFARMVFN